MQPFKLSEFPRRGRHLIEASAGTGKTHTLMDLAVRAFSEGAPAKSMLLMTFTRASTRELRARLRERIQAEIRVRSGNDSNTKQPLECLTRGLRQINQVQIQTIHGFASQLIIEFGAYSNETMRDIIENTSALQTEASLDVYQELIDCDKSGLATAVIGFPSQFIERTDLAFKNAIRWNPAPTQVPDLNKIQAEFSDLIKKLAISLPEILKLENVQEAAVKRHLSIFEKAKFPWKIPKGSVKYFKDRKQILTKNGLEAWFTISESTPTMRAYRAFVISKIRIRYLELLGARGIDDPDQMIAKANRVSSSIPNQELPTHTTILIDEFQDTDRHQWNMLNTIYPDSNDRLFVMVGDPKQAIYRFRGADTAFYTQLTNQLPNQNRWTLNRVYRSADTVVSGLNTLFSQKYEIGQKLGYSEVSTGQPGKIPSLVLDGVNLTGFQWLKLSTPEDVIQTLKSLLSLGNDHRLLCEGQPLDASDIAVLVRTRDFAQKIKRLGEEQGITCNFLTRTTVYEKPLCQDMCALLEAIAYPNDISRVVAAAATNIAGFELTSPQPFLDDPKFQDFHEQVSLAHRTWFARGANQAIATLISHCNTEAHVEESLRGLEQWADLNQAMEVFGQEAKDFSPVEAFHWWAERALAENGIDEKEMPRSPILEGVVQLSTIHGAKGLEYPVVLVAGQLMPKTPNPKAWGFDYITDEGLIVDFAANAVDSWMTDESRDLSRLIYVALTRAKHAVFVDYHAQSSGLSSLLNGRDIALLGPEHSEWHQPDIEEKLKSPSVPYLQTPSLNEPAPARWFFRSFSNLFKSESYRLDRAPAEDEYHSDNLDLSGCQKWHQIPGGTETGNLIHNILEWDSTEVYTSEERAKFISQRWPPHLNITQCPIVIDWIESIREISLYKTDCLSSIPPIRKRAEPQFELALRSGISTKNLVDKMAKLSWYKPIEWLDPKPLEGHLNGFIDLVFESHGRFHILDYKTNIIGRDDSAYSHSAIDHQMHINRYTTQAALYGLALHKWLCMTLNTYDPDKHLGKVIYLFCRGISGPCSGIWQKPLESDAICDLAAEVLDARPN